MLCESIRTTNEKTRFANWQNGFSRGGGETLKKLEGRLECLAWAEANALGSLDLDLLSGLGIDSEASLAVHNLEGAETDQLKGLALLDVSFDGIDDVVDYLFGVGLADFFAQGLLDGFNEMEFAAHGLFGLGWLCMCRLTI